MIFIISISQYLLQHADIVLVPYERRHVAKYHEWMMDPWLREMTASEPLTLDEEYAMQMEWARDNAKVTYIVCTDVVSASSSSSSSTSSSSLSSSSCAAAASSASASVSEVPASAMIGDVNLFLCDADVAEFDPDEEGAAIDLWAPPPSIVTLREAEIDVMIAVTTARRKGYARAAVQCMMRYGRNVLHVEVRALRASV